MLNRFLLHFPFDPSFSTARILVRCTTDALHEERPPTDNDPRSTVRSSVRVWQDVPLCVIGNDELHDDVVDDDTTSFLRTSSTP